MKTPVIIKEKAKRSLRLLLIKCLISNGIEINNSLFPISSDCRRFKVNDIIIAEKTLIKIGYKISEDAKCILNSRILVNNIGDIYTANNLGDLDI